MPNMLPDEAKLGFHRLSNAKLRKMLEEKKIPRSYKTYAYAILQERQRRSKS